MEKELMASRWIKATKENATWLIIFGFIEGAVGLLALLSPLYAGKALTIVIGIFLIIVGIAKLIEIFMADSFGEGALAFLVGLIALGTGVFLVTKPDIGLASLTLMLAIYFIASGITRLIIGFDLRGLKGSGWMIFDGLLSILLGFLIGWQWPLSGEWAVGILLGIHFIVSGWWSIYLGALARTTAEGLQEGQN